MIDGIPNRLLYFQQKDMIGGVHQNADFTGKAGAVSSKNVDWSRKKGDSSREQNVI